MSADDNRYDELLGAYALDALDDDERRDVDEYLRANPSALVEVDQHREVAAALGWSPLAPPDGLWERIAASLEKAPPAPSGELAKVMPMTSSRRRRYNVFGAIAVAVAAALIAVLAVGVVRKSNSSVSIKQAMDQARHTADARQLALRSPDGAVSVDVVLDAEGHGYVAGSTLPSLPSDRTYQLWGLIDGRPISLGVLGHRPGVESFSVDGNLTVLMISNEVAGGVPTGANQVGLISANLA
jgi:anti-sigma-K factor RskA